MRAAGTMGTWCVEKRVATGGRMPAPSSRPSSARRGFSAWYSAVTPSSLKRLAMVPKTGILSGMTVNASRLRCTCLATSRSASAAPLRSNLLMATNSAKSSMSIFSSWLAAPNSGVITYMGTSTSGTMAASPWPMPEVSTMIRSKPASFVAASTSGSAWLTSLPASRVASERMYTRAPDSAHGLMAFMRMRSPSSAPPLLRRDGSMEMTAMRRRSRWSSRMRRISSSVREDLPAPPVPVMPMTGVLMSLAAACTSATRSGGRPWFSSAVISWASLRHAPSPWPRTSARSAGAYDDRSLSQCITISPIIPCRPMRWPSSGLKMRTPFSASARISAGTITPPPPPNTWMCSPPRAFSRSTM